MYSSVHDLGPDPKGSKSHRETPINDFSKLGASPWVEKENLAGCCCNFPSTKSSHGLSLPLTRLERTKYLTELLKTSTCQETVSIFLRFPTPDMSVIKTHSK